MKTMTKYTTHTPTFAFITEENATMPLAISMLTDGGETDGGESLWNTITGEAGDDDVVSDYAEAVATTMPAEAVASVRWPTGIPAVFAFACMAEARLGVMSGAQPSELRAVAKAGWDKYIERAKNAKMLEEGFGLDLSPSWEAARDIEAVGDVKEMAKVAKLAGRMFNKLTTTSKKVVSDDPQNVKGITVGGDVERLLPQEITELFTPGLDDAAALRILSKRAQQFKMKGISTTSRGPLVIMVDESGSMHDDKSRTFGGCNRNSWAKACMVALARAAHAENRMVRVVHFASQAVVTELAPNGDAATFLSAVRHFLGGGTSLAHAMKKGVEQVGDLARFGYKGADLVLITDGEDGDWAAQDKVLNEAARLGIRLWSVCIEMDSPEKAPTRWRAEEYVRVSPTNEADAIVALRNAVSADIHSGASKNVDTEAPGYDGTLN